MCGQCIHCKFNNDAKWWTGQDAWNCEEAMDGNYVDPEEEAPKRCFKAKETK
jgi:hypothetical protein